ncbi:MAG TPA: SusD/RagB family nutrient-binding outer membrane lipoprotein [Gemmatimonadales bacterium]
MRYKILSVFAALAAITACSDLTSINQNPNGPVDVPPPSILPNVIQTVVGGVNGVNSLNIRGGGLWVQYYSEIQYRDEDKYLVRSGTSGGWGFYNGALEDIRRMIIKGEANKTPNWSAVGRIMKSYVFSVMTDAMGNLPYSQALKGDTVLNPAYDTQQAIYNGMLADLAQANTDIDLAPGAVGFSDGDLMYGGKMAKWKRFANSLRLRLAIHLSKADPTKAASEAAAAVAAGVFTSNADNAQLMYLGTSPNRNPIYNDAQGRDDYGMSKTFVDSLTSFADPRLPVFAQINPAGTGYQGLPNGLNDGEGTPIVNISRFGAFWRSTPNAPMYLLTYSEVLFLEAEAAERGWIPGGSAAAATYYTNAITASLQQYGVAAADIATYLGQAKVGYDAGGTTLGAHMNQIMYQKWVSLFMQGMEAWTEVRRTGIPSLIPGPRAVFGAGTAGSIPQRLPYDDNEAVLNAANLDAAVSAQGFSAGNDIQSKLWFAK